MAIAPCPPKTAGDLDWRRVQAALSQRCVFELGKELARDLSFASDRAEALVRLAECREATLAFTDGEPLPLSELPDVREALGRLRAQGVLGAAELRDLGRMLEVAKGLRRYLGTRRERMPALHAGLGMDPTLDAVASEVLSSFDESGAVADDASPRLKELRSEYRTAKNRMVSRMEELMRRYESVVQDSFITEREGRWVVPVRSDAHERFPGIVHATSGSGATLYIEPRAVIPMGNRLKVLEGEVLREEIMVLTRLSQLLSDALPSVMACADTLARADLRAATGKLAAEFDLRFPRVSTEPVFELRAARHLGLVMDGVDVVPCDISLKAGGAIVISGPNAGGKTVSLKTLGLCALMLRAGLPVPAREDSEMGFVLAVLTDVGDDQSIAQNLSTFSAHVKNLTQILDQAQPGVLVLLDEVCTGTDPREGEALAAGVLDSLLKRGAAVFATTHYEGLKALALGDARFQNASYTIDVNTMAPTFRLAMGVPGSSSALQVAKRFGMPSTVLERAARFLSREDLRFEELVQKLHEERAALELARAEAEQRAAEAEKTRVELRAEIERVRARGNHEIEEGVRHLTDALKRARDDLRSAQGRLRQKKPEVGSLKEAERSLDNVAREIGVGGALGSAVSKTPEGLTPIALDKLKKGMRVWVPRLRANAEIIMIHGAEVRVAAGPLKLTVSVHEIMASAPEEAPVAPTPRSRLGEFKESPEVPIQTSDNTCDVRGLRADDAMSMVLSFLDRSVGENRRVAFIVHGHGTGALRDALRAELERSPYAQGMRPGGRGEGGDGVTIVWLK